MTSSVNPMIGGELPLEEEGESALLIDEEYNEEETDKGEMHLEDMLSGSELFKNCLDGVDKFVQKEQTIGAGDEEEEPIDVQLAKEINGPIKNKNLKNADMDTDIDEGEAENNRLQIEERQKKNQKAANAKEAKIKETEEKKRRKAQRKEKRERKEKWRQEKEKKTNPPNKIIDDSDDDDNVNGGSISTNVNENGEKNNEAGNHCRKGDVEKENGAGEEGKESDEDDDDEEDSFSSDEDYEDRELNKKEKSWREKIRTS